VASSHIVVVVALPPFLLGQVKRLVDRLALLVKDCASRDRDLDVEVRNGKSIMSSESVDLSSPRMR
jgi:hypothetical protein